LKLAKSTLESAPLQANLSQLCSCGLQPHLAERRDSPGSMEKPRGIFKGLNILFSINIRALASSQVPISIVDVKLGFSSTPNFTSHNDSITALLEGGLHIAKIGKFILLLDHSLLSKGLANDKGTFVQKQCFFLHIQA